MSRRSPWINDSNAALLTDLYELTMLQAFWKENMDDSGVFSLFSRNLSENRNYLIACGLDDVLHFLENVRFEPQGIDYLRSLGQFHDDFLEWLSTFRFTGDVYAMAEGTPFFADEPVLEVEGPIVEAQLMETFILNQIHFQTVAASKASRVVMAAGKGAVVDFGLRRMPGTDAGTKSVRAFHIAGVKATSNVFGGYVYGVPVTGTMAHSYIQSHDKEMEAFRAFTSLYPETILLVDTYDTLEGVRKVVELAREMGDDFKVRGIRLDSGDLIDLAFRSREILDKAGLQEVSIFASGGLDEYKIAEMVQQGAPINGFGVGTRMGVSEDGPSLDMAYKLTSYSGRGRLKTSSGKQTLPGKKQVWRIEENGRAVRDIITDAEESAEGRPLLKKVMQGGKRIDGGMTDLDHAREHCRRELSSMPQTIRSIAPAEPPFPVEISTLLKEKQERIIRSIT